MKMMDSSPRVMVLGVGAFAQAVCQILKDNGCRVCTYLTRQYAHYPPSLAGEIFSAAAHPSPCPLVRDLKIDFVIPMSIDWAQQPWATEFLSMNVPILSPTGEAMLIERDRGFAQKLCSRFGVPFPRAFSAQTETEARRILEQHRLPLVIKNPLCSPTSPLHTIICESYRDTLSWLDRIDYGEGVFLQEYMGRREAGHIAFISAGEIYSLVTNQEYKRAFNGNMGIVAGAPLGGLVEVDPEDRYQLARQLLHPLLPWFRKTNYHGPVQVTAAWHEGKWYVLEYNIRLGVTCAAMVLRLLQQPVRVLSDVVNNRPLDISFADNFRYGASLTLAGIGYPYIKVTGPKLPIEIAAPFDCDVWWNEVCCDETGQLAMEGHRLADVVAFGLTLDEALQRAYRNIRKIRCLSSYYRTDIGQSLWPPTNE